MSRYHFVNGLFQSYQHVESKEEMTSFISNNASKQSMARNVNNDTGNVSFNLESFIDKFKSDHLKISEPTTVTLLVLYVPVFFAALLGNILVIVVVLSRKHKQNLTEYFLLNLAVADLLVTLFCIPLSVAEAVYAIWIYGEIMCKSTAYLQGVTISASVLTITALCFDRFLAIRHPIKSRRLGNKCSIRVTMFIIWLVSGVIMLPLGVVKRLRDVPGTDIRFCIEDWHNSQQRQIYDIFLLCFIYAIPGSLMIGMYSAMGRRLCHTGSVLNRNGSDVSGLQRMLVERRRVAWMMVIVALLFGLCWLPYHIVSTCIDFDWYTNAYLSVLPFSILVGHSNSALNPIVYAFMYKNFRRRIMVAFRCSRRSDTTDSQVYELVRVSVFSAVNGSRASQYLSRSSRNRRSTARFATVCEERSQGDDQTCQLYINGNVRDLEQTTHGRRSQSKVLKREPSGTSCAYTSLLQSNVFHDTPLSRDTEQTHIIANNNTRYRYMDTTCTDSDENSPMHSSNDGHSILSEKPLVKK